MALPRSPVRSSPSRSRSPRGDTENWDSDSWSSGSDSPVPGDDSWSSGSDFPGPAPPAVNLLAPAAAILPAPAAAPPAVDCWGNPDDITDDHRDVKAATHEFEVGEASDFIWGNLIIGWKIKASYEAGIVRITAQDARNEADLELEDFSLNVDLSRLDEYPLNEEGLKWTSGSIKGFPICVRTQIDGNLRFDSRGIEGFWLVLNVTSIKAFVNKHNHQSK